MIKLFKRIRFRIKQRLNRKLKPLECLQKKTHLSLDQVVLQVEAAVSSKIKGSVNLKTEYKPLGGSNNFGFFCHTFSESSKSSWVTKLALTEMLKRERFFLQWHQNTIDPKKQFAPVWLTDGELEGSSVSFMVVEGLLSIKKPSFQQVSELYQRCQQGGRIFQYTDSVPILESGSRIRDVLVNLVCQFDSSNATVFLENFFLERKIHLPSFQKKINWIQESLKTLRLEIGEIKPNVLGFVHGDFKASNMMLSSEGDLKLIDFQYWCYGIRTWDVAFFLSKQKVTFQKAIPAFMAFLELCKQEKKILIFSYVIAVLLHPKPKQFNWQFKHQIVPALTMLNDERVTL